MGQGQVVLVFGPTGTAGSGAVQACLMQPGVSAVRAVTRRPLGISHGKLQEVHCSDFADLTSILHHLEGIDCCLFCLGTSVRNVAGEREYREIHVTYACAAARALLSVSPRAAFIYLSGAGARSDSRMMWARVKAEAEDELSRLDLARHANVRPAAILPVKPTGANRWLMRPLLRLAPALGIRSVELGQAMLALGLDRKWHGSRTLQNSDLRLLARSGPSHSGSTS